MDLFVHVANVLFLSSYLVRDILWLRFLTIIAIGTLIPFYYLQPEPLWAPIGWNIGFIIINGIQIYLLLLERKPVHLPERELELYRKAFRSLTPREMQKLTAIGSWAAADDATELVAQGVHLDDIHVLAEGEAAVRVGDREVARVQPGQFIGEMSFLTGAKTSASVTASGPVSYLSWPQQKLREFLKANTELRAALQMVIGQDLVGKLQHEDAA